MTWAVLVLALSVVAVGVALRAGWEANRRSTVAGRLPPPLARGRGRVAAIADRRARRVLRPPSWLEPALTDAAVDMAPSTVWVGWLGAVVAATSLAAVASGPAAAVLAFLAVGGLPPVALRSRRGRADSRLERELPLALESIARSLRSGASVGQAIAEAAESAGGSGGSGGRRRRGRGRGRGRGRLQAGH